MQYQAKQISGTIPSLQPALSVLVKQTFGIDEKGNCWPLTDSDQLVDNITYYEHNDQILKEDSDLFVHKKYCDIVIKGKARNFGGEKKFIASIRVGEKQLDISVQGNRKPYLDVYGKLIFGEPEIAHEIPLRFDFAYGGKDTESEKKLQLPSEEIMAAMPEHNWYADSPYRYQRNPEGKGFIVEHSKAMIEQLELPNLEDPDHPVTPENIIVGDVNRWIEMPIPQATDWISHAWVPRLLYTGLVEFPYQNTDIIKECKLKLVEPDIYSKKQLSTGFNYRFFNGAHYGLQINPLVSPGICTLTNIHPTYKNMDIKLPKMLPKIWTDGRNGKLNETQTFLHSIIIYPEENKLNMVWRGTAPALRPYMKQELELMPFKVEF